MKVLLVLVTEQFCPSLICSMYLNTKCWQVAGPVFIPPCVRLCSIIPLSVASGPSKALISNTCSTDGTESRQTGHAASKQQLKLCTVHSNNPFIYSSACNTSDLPVGGVLFPTRAAAAGRHLCGVSPGFSLLLLVGYRTGWTWCFC